MPMNRTRSTLAKKYGQKAVVKARNAIANKMGYKTVTEENAKKLPWGLIGYIAKKEKDVVKKVPPKKMSSKRTKK